ncbi:glyoxalase [Streptomyces sp. NPDC048172]|uniref:glyoxalase n=1 Tax=Streptomyces sp. NPDC048172 TaxID=3365505 RepID=UPI00372430E0
MTSLASVTLEVADTTAAERFHDTAFGLGLQEVRLRSSEAPTTGFRGFTLSITVPRPADVRSFTESAVAAGATSLKAPEKSLWGYGSVVQAPDGTIWKLATSSKKEAGPATRTIEQLVLLLGVEDVKASKQFYVGQGLAVEKSFGGKYVEFAADKSGSGTGTDAFTLALYKRPGLAKIAGVPVDGTGSHRIVLGSSAGSFTDPDGFAWEATSLAAPASS